MALQPTIENIKNDPASANGNVTLDLRAPGSEAAKVQAEELKQAQLKQQTEASQSSQPTGMDGVKPSLPVGLASEASVPLVNPDSPSTTFALPKEPEPVAPEGNVSSPPTPVPGPVAPNDFASTATNTPAQPVKKPSFFAKLFGKK